MGARKNLDKFLVEIGVNGGPQLVTFAQLRQGSGLGRIVKDFGVSLMASAVTSAVGLTVFRNTLPALVWVVIAGERLLLIERPAGGSRVGGVVFHAPLSAVTAVDRSGLRGAVELVDAQHGDVIALFNFGLRKSAAQKVLTVLV